MFLCSLATRACGVREVERDRGAGALDINAHLLAELGSEIPEEYYGGFARVGELGILRSDLAGSLAPSAGFGTGWSTSTRPSMT